MNFNEWGFCIVTHEVARRVLWIGYENLSHSSKFCFAMIQKIFPTHPNA